MIKIKSISKRVLAVLLATLMLLTSGIVGTLAANVDFAETGAYTELAETGGSVVYFNNTAGWSNVYCHMWDGGNATNWPGKKMTKVTGTDYWSIDVGANKKCIFHNNSGTQTADLTVSNGQIYHYDLNMWDVYPPVYIDTIYLDTSNVSWSIINCHKWIPNGEGTQWPGATMEKVTGKENLYSISRGNSIYCIFNNKTSSTDGGNFQTTDLAILRNGQNCFVLESNITGYWTTYTPVKEYTVKFYNADGTQFGSSQTVKSGEYPENPGTPTKSSTVDKTYTFKGWATEQGSTTIVDDVTSIEITGNTAYYAVFNESAREYTVTFNADNGSANTTQPVAYGKTVSKPANPTKDADAQYTYTFDYWAHNGTKWNFDTATITGDITLTAVYTKTTNEYTVEFVDYAGNQVGSTQTVAYGGTASDPGLTEADVPAEAGKYFDGWQWDFATTIVGDTTIKAKYGSYDYDVTINVKPNDATGISATPSADTAKYGDTVTITANSTNNLYVFDKWVISGDNYEALTDLTNPELKVKVYDDITVEAQFKKLVTRTITIKQSGYDTTKNNTSNHSIKFDGVIKFTNAPEGTKNIVDVLEGEHTIYICGPVNHYIAGFKVNGDDVMAQAKQGQSEWVVSYTFNVTADIDIEVVYHYNPTITIKTKVDGVASSNLYSDEVCNYNGTKTIILSEKPGYYISGIEGLGSYDFTNGTDTTLRSKSITLSKVTEDVVATVSYKDLPTFTVEVKADTTKGSVSPAVGTHDYEPGTTVNFTAKPNSGYYTEWYVNGNKQTKGNTFTYTVNSSVTVEAKFLEQQWDCVLFVKKDNNWSDVYAYVWKSGGGSELLGGFPGTKMELIDETNKVYAIYINVPADQIENYRLILSNGSNSGQTGDLAFVKGSNYYTLSSGTWSYSDREYTPTKYVYGVNGSKISGVEKGNYNNATYRGDVTFPTQTALSNIDSTDVYYVKAQWNGVNDVEILTTVIDDDFKVDGWVINGRRFVSATKTTVTNEFRGSIPASYLDEVSNDAVAVYSHSDVWFTAHSDVGTVRLFADISKAPEITAYNWGEYISAYTWNAKDTTEGDLWYDGGYEQFGEWEGQIMIPVGEDKPGLFYTIVEKKGTGNYPNNVMGITFTNFGGHSPCNNSVSFLQTYDYYEFIELQDKDNIVFVLEPTDTISNQANISNINNVGMFADLVNWGNEKIDIYRDELNAEEITANEIGLYVVRTGPNDSTTTTNSDIIDGQYYVDCYVYDANKTFIGRCKSYELLDLESLAKTQSAFKKLVDNKANYEGKIVKVAYEAPNYKEGNNTRVDGEWFGTDATTTVTLTARVAQLTKNGYEVSDKNSESYGTATIGGAGVWTGPMSSETIPGSITTGSDYKFVGWYHGTLDANGNVIVDTTKDVISVFTDHKFTPYSNSYYVAVFEELASGTFTVNNYSYEGNPNNSAAPPVFNKIGRDASYRYVKIDKIDENGNVIEAGVKSDIYTDSPWASTINVTEGDILSITIYTTPKYPTDKVYAWYMEAPEADGTLNFEEVGTDVIGNFGLGEEATFTFTYVITENYQKNMIIYSDILTETAEITLEYQYLNRYGSLKRYTKTHTLFGQELSDKAPSAATIAKNAPYVNDLYKDIKWVIKECKADSTGTRFILEATYDREIVVNVHVEGSPVGSIRGEFNEAHSLYATDYDNDAKPVTNKGFWYVENGEDGVYTEGSDSILSYGTYYGLVFTKDMDINYVTTDSLDFKVILNSPVYGREQATGGIDKVYTDFIINYLVPYFSGDIVNGEQIIDVENKNAPVQLDIYAEAAGVTVEYGMVHQLINTYNSDAAVNDQNLKDYFNTNPLSEDEIKAFENFLNTCKETGKTSGMDSTGQLLNYKYTGKNDLTNKNRALMTFITNNSEANRNKYFTAIAYLAITDANGDTKYYFSNVELFNIKDFVENNKGSDIVE